jgi:hypothetical protein
LLVKETPGGRAPLVTAKEYGAIPPLPVMELL